MNDALAVFDHVKLRHADVTVMGEAGSGVAVQLAAAPSRLVLVTPFDRPRGERGEGKLRVAAGGVIRDRYKSASRARGYGTRAYRHRGRG